MLWILSFKWDGPVVVDLSFIVVPIVCGGFVFGLCFVISTLCPSDFAINLMERERYFNCLNGRN